MEIKKGDRIKVDYVGSLEDGTVFDSSKNHGPLEFEVGSGQLIKGFDDAVIGLKKGDEKKITLKPEEAYGNRDMNLVKEIPRKQLPQNADAKPGMVLVMRMPNGVDIPATISDINDNTVTIDLNPPLAGKTLNFAITILDIM